MRQSFFSKKFLAIAVFLFTAAVLAANSADAHSFIIKPVRLSVPVGGATDVWVSLSEPFAAPDIGLYGYGAVIGANLTYADGSKEQITGFEFFNKKNPFDTDPANSDAQKAKISIAEPGTVMASAKMTMQMPASVNPDEPRLVCFAKAALNTISDGAAKAPVSDGDVLEIVPLHDLNEIRAGEEFEVKVLFKGNPLRGVLVSAAYDGAPLESGEQGFTDSDVTDDQGIAAVTPDRAAYWLLYTAHPAEENGKPHIYQATLVIPVNGRVGETEGDVTDKLMPAASNAAGLGFGDFFKGQQPEADEFEDANKLTWAHNVATGSGSSKPLTGGKNQLDGNSGVAFTIETEAGPEIGAFTGFFGIYAFTPENIGNDTYASLADKLARTPPEPEGMIVPDMGELFSGLGLHVYQIYYDGSQRDVTDLVVDAGFDISKQDEGEIAMWWGALIADRDASEASYSIPVVLSSIGEDGHILFDGRKDDRIDGKFYIARGGQSSSGGGGCDAGTLGVFAMASLCCALALCAPKKRK
ncbi:MAG: DUF4198 domain-containing protein [Synergistaceae bacterium]|nr:DUF4198 domain-containing protein [Synergistaceae bacterium]